MANKQTQDYDVFRRICRKQCVPPAEEEIEIFEAESDAELPEEEELPLDAEEPFDLVAWSYELECMKRRILMLQIKLKEKLNACPEEECIDLELELSCSENKDICTLQKNHYKLQLQINELVRCCRFAKEQIKDLRTRMCEKSKDIQQLQKATGLLESWRRTLDNEFGKCIERFEYLKHAKAEWQDVLTKIENLKKILSSFQENYVPQFCYNHSQREIKNRTDSITDLLKNLCVMHSERFVQIEQRLENIEARLPPLPQNIKTREMQTEKTKECPLEAIKLKNENSVNKIFFGAKELKAGKCVL